MSSGAFSSVKNFITVDECDRIINSLPVLDLNECTVQLKPAELGTWYKNDITDKRIALPVDETLENRIRKEVIGEQFVSTGKMYITKYEAGEFCKRHFDPVDITVIILLNNDFTGGNFILERFKPKLNAGDMIVFDKGTYHNVTEVTSGCRYALSIWFNKQQQDKHSAPKR